MWREAEGLGQETEETGERKKVPEQRETLVCSRRLRTGAQDMGCGWGLGNQRRFPLENFEFHYLLNLISRNVLSSRLFNFLIYLVKRSTCLPQPSTPVLYWLLLETHTPRTPKPPTDPFCLTLLVPYMVILTALKECSLMLPQWMFQNSGHCSSPLSFLAHTLATRWFCDLLSCPQPLSKGSDFLGATHPTLPPHFLFSFCLSPTSCPAGKGNRTVSFRLRRFGFASTGDHEQGTQVFRDSVFSCAEVALCDVLGIADALFMKPLSTQFSNGVNSLRSLPVNFERF